MKTLAEAFALIRDVPDFPKEGIVFKDITPLLADMGALNAVIEDMARPWRDKKIDLVCGMESRGFIFGTLLAKALNVGFIPVRKPGKLPYDTESVSYGLEYGTDTLEIHTDACNEKRVLICDDLMATGGTALATTELVERVGGEVAGLSFAVELSFLKGRDRLGKYEQHSSFVVD